MPSLGQLQEMTSGQLMRRVKFERDREAYDLLMERHHKPMSSWLFLRNRRIPHPDAEEILQDTKMAVWRKAHTWDDEGGAFGPWLIKILQNRANLFLRQRSRIPFPPEDEIDFTQVMASNAEQLDPELIAIAAEDRDIARYIFDRGLSTLSDQDRETLSRYFDRATGTEIAEAMGISEHAASKRISRAKTRLSDAVFSAFIELRYQSLGSAEAVRDEVENRALLLG